MFAAVETSYPHFQPRPGLPAHSATVSRTANPAAIRREARIAAGGSPGTRRGRLRPRAAVQPGMRSMAVVPLHDLGKLGLKCLAALRTFSHFPWGFSNDICLSTCVFPGENANRAAQKKISASQARSRMSEFHYKSGVYPVNKSCPITTAGQSPLWIGLPLPLCHSAGYGRRSMGTLFPCLTKL